MKDSPFHHNVFANVNQKHLIGGVCHMIGSMLTNLGYCFLSASLTQVLKAGEPIFTVGLSAMVYGTSFTLDIYLSVFYCSMGLALFSCSDASFNLQGFVVTMMSNTAIPLRNIICSDTLSGSGSVSGSVLIQADSHVKAVKLSSHNSFFLSSLIAFVVILPVMILLLPSQVGAGAAVWSSFSFVTASLNAAMLHATYNLASYQFLGITGPITHTIANVCKRVFIVMIAMYFYNESIAADKALSLFVLFVGVSLYLYCTKTKLPVDKTVHAAVIALVLLLIYANMRR